MDEDFTKEPLAAELDHAFMPVEIGLTERTALRTPISQEHWSEYTKNGTRRLLDSFVCFLDLLGTRGVRSDLDAQRHLEATSRAMTMATHLIARDRPGRWFSDNLSTFIPITLEVPAHVALPDLLVEAAAVQYAMTVHGFTARGAITRGLFCADQRFVHGPALERAYALEQHRARFPRIVLDEAAVAAASSSHAVEHSDWPRWLLRGSDGIVFLDYLFAASDGTGEQGWLLDGLGRHRETVQEGVFRFDGVAGVEEKFVWLAGYHNYAVGRMTEKISELGGSVEELTVTCSRATDAFDTFG